MKSKAKKKKRSRIRLEFPVTRYVRKPNGGMTNIQVSILKITGTEPKYTPYLTIDTRAISAIADTLYISNPRTLESLARNILKALNKK